MNYQDYLFINKNLKSYGYAYRINKDFLKWGLFALALVTPFTNWVLIPLSLNIKSGSFYIRVEKGLLNVNRGFCKA